MNQLNKSKIKYVLINNLLTLAWLSLVRDTTEGAEGNMDSATKMLLTHRDREGLIVLETVNYLIH